MSAQVKRNSSAKNNRGILSGCLKPAHVICTSSVGCFVVFRSRIRKGNRAVLTMPDFFLLRAALKDSPQGPPTANHHQLPTTNCHHQPPTANRHQPPTANCQPLKERRSDDQDAESVPVNVRSCWRYEGLFFCPSRTALQICAPFLVVVLSIGEQRACISSTCSHTEGIADGAAEPAAQQHVRCNMRLPAFQCISYWRLGTTSTKYHWQIHTYHYNCWTKTQGIK